MAGARQCAWCGQAIQHETAERKQRDAEKAADKNKETLARFIEAANAAGNPGASPLWLEPIRICAEECGRRYMRAWKKRSSHNWDERWRLEADHLRKQPPVGHGWLFKPEYPPSIYYTVVARGEKVKEETKWYPVVMTTGEVRACHASRYDESGGWVGFPLLCRPDSKRGRSDEICASLAGKGVVLSADELHARAAQLGITLS